MSKKKYKIGGKKDGFKRCLECQMIGCPNRAQGDAAMEKIHCDDWTIIEKRWMAMELMAKLHEKGKITSGVDF